MKTLKFPKNWTVKTHTVGDSIRVTIQGDGFEKLVAIGTEKRGWLWVHKRVTE